jgi:probable F420-dependent oxidoreductase
MPAYAEQQPQCAADGRPRPLLRVGVQIQPHHVPYSVMRNAWVKAEELGVDSIFTWDHFFPPGGDFSGKHFECLTTLGSMAEVTSRAQIGALVCCNSYRNPELLADAHRTIDHASDGRAVFGIGAGWFRYDYDEYGYVFGTMATRVRALAEALPRIKSRLEKLDPPPIGRLPLLIGAGGERVMLRLVARYADMWHASGSLADFIRKEECLRSHCASVGRNHTEIERLWDIRPHALGEAESLRAAGVSHLILAMGGYERYDLGPLRELIEWRDDLAK